jgi:hypothetical protein
MFQTKTDQFLFLHVNCGLFVFFERVCVSTVSLSASA